MNKTVGLDIAKLNLFFVKPNNLNFPEKNVPSQTCLAWVSDHFAVGVEHPSRTTFFSILILLCHSSTGLWAKPCRAAPTSLKYDFKDACERLDNLFIDTTTLKQKQARAFLIILFFPIAM